MQENVSVLIASIVAVIIIVLFPIYNIAVRQDSIANNMVVRATTSFVDDVRNKGYIDKEAYGKFLNELDKSGNTYDVEMEVYKPILLEISPEAEEYEEKYEIDYTEDIISDMENELLNKDIGSVKKKNAYYLEEDYKFYVRVKNSNITQAQILLDRLLGGKQNERIVVNYGGTIYTNEWAAGEGAENAEANISISRPLDYDLNEYRYEYITTTYDSYTGETEDLYAIAIRLDDEVENSGIIKFILEYNSVQFKNEEGVILTDVNEIRRHIESNLELFGVDDIDIEAKNIDVDVPVGGITERDGYYDAKFIITFKDIVYNYDANPYINTKARVKAGSAYSSSGKIGELTSTEFVIYYNVKLPQIDLTSTSPTNIITDNSISLSETETQTEVTFNMTAKSNSTFVENDKIVFKLKKDNVIIVDEEIDVSGAVLDYQKKLTLEKGRYQLALQVIDSRGLASEEKTYEFVIANRVKETFKIAPVVQGQYNTISVPKKEGYKIVSYNLNVYFPNRTMNDDWDWYSIKQTDSGETSYVVPQSTSGVTYNPLGFLRKYSVYRREHLIYDEYAYIASSRGFLINIQYTDSGLIKDGAELAKRLSSKTSGNYTVKSGNVACDCESLTFNYRINPTNDITSGTATKVYSTYYDRVAFYIYYNGKWGYLGSIGSIVNTGSYMNVDIVYEKIIE